MTHPVLQARRKRAARIRKTVAVTAATLFIALFSTIYVQMAAGHDPALSSKTTSTQATATATPSSTTSGSSSSTTDSSPMTTSAS